MSISDPDQERIRQEQKLSIQRLIAFASGLFQGDVTIRTLLESLAEGVVIIDNTGTILLVNLRVEKIFDYPREELIGKSLVVLIPERFRKVHEEHVARFFAKPRIRPMDQRTEPPLELVGLHRDGSEFPLEISLGFIETINGVFALAFVSDITLRRQYEACLRESEEMFHIQIESVKNYAVYTLDAKGNVLNWNAGAERLKGYRADEIIGKHFSCFYSEKDRNAGKPEAELKKAAAEGQFAGESWRFRKDGSRFWAEVIISALHNEDGSLRGFSKVTQDITGRKIAEDALRFSEDRYRAVFEDNPTMIVTLDTEWTILSANPSCAKQLGYTIDELKGHSVLSLFHGNDHAAVIEQLQGCLSAPNHAHRWQFRKVRKDGVTLWVEETAQAVHDLNGALNILVVCQDVTEQKRAEEALRESDARFHAIFDLAAVGIAQVSLNGRWMLMNQKLSDTLGYSFDELRNMTLQQISHPDDIEPHLARIRRLLAGDVPSYSIEKRYICKDGSILWVNLNVTLVRDKYGKPEYFVAIVENIDKRKKVQDALQESEERFRLMADTAPVLIWMSGTDALCTFFSKPWLEFTGRSFEQEQGNGWAEGVHPEDLERCQETYRSAFSARRDFQVEYRLRRADGEYRWMIDTGVPRFMPNGDFVGYIGSCLDISERKYAEEKIQNLNMTLAEKAEELIAVNKELEAFNYTVAHDLRQPLNIISSCCQIIEKLSGDKLDEDCKGPVQMAYSSALRMDRLIDALLNFSRMGHIAPNRETIDLSAIAHELIGTLKQTEPERQVDFLIANEIMANCDSNLLRSVLANLLGNAWKYTRTREKTVIEFGVRDIDGGPIYFVRDNGTGFAMTEADKLFTPFQRLPGAEKQRGFGIGLATVERIIRRHGGKVWAEGELDKGACFYFTLSAGEV